MALPALVGGADCGPSNPLATLTKSFTSDRSLQHDRLASSSSSPDGTPVAGPSRQGGFRSRLGFGVPPPAGPDERFFVPQAARMGMGRGVGPMGGEERFDMAPLGRALTPNHLDGRTHRDGTPPPASAVGAVPPAWAADFMALDPNVAYGNAPGHVRDPMEAARMEAAFPGMRGGKGRGAPGPAMDVGWARDFAVDHAQLGPTQHRRASEVTMSRNSSGPGGAMMLGPRGRGRGMGMNMGMGVPMGGMMMGMREQQSRVATPENGWAIEDVSVMEDKESWDSAFLAHDAMSTSPALSNSSVLSRELQVPLPGPQSYSYQSRSHSPVQLDSSSASADALARTAASLLETVGSRQEAERLASAVQPDADEAATGAAKTRDKFASSSFMELMRKLRDGEVKVEGDRVVEQIVPVAQGKGKGRATEDSSAGGVWAGEYGQALNPAPGMNAQAQTQRPGDGLYSSFHNQTLAPSFAHHRPMHSDDGTTSSLAAASGGPPGVAVDEILRAEERAWLEDYERGMREMNEVMDDDYAQREAAELRKQRNAFQGDGGAIRGDIDDLMDAADQVDEMPSRPSHGLVEEEWNRPFAADTRVPGASERWAEDPFALDQEEDDDRWDPRNIVGAPLTQEDFRKEAFRRDRMAKTAQQREWEALQDAMDADMMEETIAAAEQASGYSFQRNNPYVADSEFTTTSRHHRFHLGSSPLASTSQYSASSATSGPPPSEGVLEKEAAVQRDPTSAQAWLELGIKQQENEREPMAIRALERALTLDPSLDEAELALAVSYTNEGERPKAFEALEKWVNLKVDGSPTYRIAVAELGKDNALSEELLNGSDQRNPVFAAGLGERHAKLMETLITLARAGGTSTSSTAGGTAVDADVQIALGVLFNTSEEYDKAGDCFAAALQTRPEDPLLFNRLGATLANSGKAEEAIQYYLRALELQPSYVRARYNLAISNVNLHRYQEAAQYLLAALDMQRSDTAHIARLVGSDEAPGVGGETESGEGMMSEALWETLGMCASLLQRPDLADHCARRDLDAFRAEFSF